MKGLRLESVGGGEKAGFEQVMLGRRKKAAGAVSSRALIASTWTRSILGSGDLDLNLNQEGVVRVVVVPPFPLDWGWDFFLALDLIHWKRSELIFFTSPPLDSGAAWVIRETRNMLVGSS